MPFLSPHQPDDFSSLLDSTGPLFDVSLINLSLEDATRAALRARLPWTAELGSVLTHSLAIGLVDLIYHLDQVAAHVKTQGYIPKQLQDLRDRLVRTTLPDYDHDGDGWHNASVIPHRSLTSKCTDQFLSRNFPHLLLKIQCICLQALVPGIRPNKQVRHELVRQIVLRIFTHCLPLQSITPPQHQTLQEEDAHVPGLYGEQSQVTLRRTKWGAEGLYFQRLFGQYCTTKVKLAPLITTLVKAQEDSDLDAQIIYRRMYRNVVSKTAKLARQRLRAQRRRCKNK
ncbi:hypothetical protein FRC03_011957 [Tulasnella sp. 419]|nr:hypothetical protein FRC03_011957 [Tulasnella sp. 419]